MTDQVTFDTTAFRAPGGPGGHDDDLMSTDREMLGQILTFCAFVGAIALAALIELVYGQPLEGVSPDDPLNAAMPFLQSLLAAVSGVSLLGAFFALLGYVNHSRLATRQARFNRLRPDDPRYLPARRDMIGKYANIVIFRQMSRLFASVSMATALFIVVILAFLVDAVVGIGLCTVVASLLVIPIVIASALRRHLVRQVDAALGSEQPTGGEAGDDLSHRAGMEPGFPDGEKEQDSSPDGPNGDGEPRPAGGGPGSRTEGAAKETPKEGDAE